MISKDRTIVASSINVRHLQQLRPDVCYEFLIGLLMMQVQLAFKINGIGYSALKICQ